MFIYEISIIVLVCRKLVSVGPVQQTIKLPLPKKYIGNIKSLLQKIIHEGLI